MSEADVFGTIGADDAAVPFQVAPLEVRGRVVRLGPAIDKILARHAYPGPVSTLLGEAVALTVLLGTSLKFDGRFQLQTRSDGPVDMIVVDFEVPDRIRAYARFDAERVAEAASHGPRVTGELLGRGHLALTVDPGGDMGRYQGVVPLDGGDLEQAAHRYFDQSEQIPTRVRLAVAESWRGGDLGQAWRAGGILVQFLPAASERMRGADLHPGDAPEGIELPEVPEDDAWVEARALVETVEDHELTDPTLTTDRLLYRLFHERGVRVFEPQPVHEACRCSRQRIAGMMQSFTPEERRDMIADDGAIEVTCEFCSTRYRFDPAEFDPPN